MRLIDADGLKNVIYESWGGDPYYHTSKGYPEKTETEIRAEAASLFLENIDAQPTIEAEPKHGRWIDRGSGQECSVCGEIQYGYDSYRNYCAYCGADMREVEE